MINKFGSMGIAAKDNHLRGFGSCLPMIWAKSYFDNGAASIVLIVHEKSRLTCELARFNSQEGFRSKPHHHEQPDKTVLQ